MMKLAQMERIAHRLDRELLTTERRSKWDDMAELGALLTAERGTWKQQMHELWVNGTPVNLGGGIAGLEGAGSPPTDVTVTQTAAAILIWPVDYTPIRGGSQSPTIWQLFAAGVQTTAATPGTVQFEAGIGATAGTNLLGSATTALALTASQTATIWRIQGIVVAPRTGGGGVGNVATATGYFEVAWTTGTAGPGAWFAGTPIAFGGNTAANYNPSPSTNLNMSTLTATSTTNTITPRIVLWGSWN